MAEDSGKARGPRYQSMLVLLLGVNMGVVFLDRNAFSLLAPMIQPEFGLTNAQVGMVTGVLAAAWAVSSFGLTRLADLTGRTKFLLLAATVIFSLASISSGLAIGFLTLLCARALMGLAEGGLPPLSTHIVSSEVPPERRGLALGMLSTIGINAIPLLGPLLIVGLGEVYGWRQAFWIAGVPGLIMAALIWYLVRNPARAHHEVEAKAAIGPLLATRNIRFTLVLATLSMTLFVGTLGFLPLYLVNVSGLSNTMMGVVMTTQGAAGVAFGFAIPMLSDRIGRKPAIILAYAIGAVGYLIVAAAAGNLLLLFLGTMLAIAGGAGAGILVMNVVAGESAPGHLKATAMGFNAAVGELLGAGAMPVVIGKIADDVGLWTLPWLMVAVALLLCGVALGLRETAPRIVERGMVPA